MRILEQTYGEQARDCLQESTEPGVEGARAALESFYHSFNQRSETVLRQVWADDPLVQLNNPLGG
ncbi:MAG: DUF4440 domain-containing protein, partial [Actinomycetota bacterium]